MRNSSEIEVCPRCQRCERWRAAPDYIRDPMVLWDRFPCPPPGTDHAKLLIELDWTGRMGPKSGCVALQRVARRCHVDFKNLHSIHLSLPECAQLFQAGVLCGTNCFIAFILAGICVLFCLLLVIVCVRYVRREKQSSSFCSKVLSPSSADANTHINKDYAQSDDNYRPNGVPRRRGLPYEARMTNSGVEARLLKAIQENQLQQYHTDDTCSQCLATSRQNTMQLRGNRLGYEVIYWKDGDFFVQRVPSNDTISRMSLNRDGSIYGGSVTGSHHYEYIGGHQTDCSYSSNGRHSNHSNRCYARNSVQNINDVSDPCDSIGTEIDRGSVRCGSAIDHYSICRTIDPCANYKAPWKSSRTSVNSIHSRYQDREPNLNYFTERSPYQPSGSDGTPYCEYTCSKPLRQGYYSDSYSMSELAVPKNRGIEYDSDHLLKEINSSLEHNSKEGNTEAKDANAIKGYKYVFNPSGCEDLTDTQYNDDNIDLQQLQNAIFELTGYSSEQNLNEVPHKSKAKQRRPSTCSNASTFSESASTSGHSSNVTKSILPEASLPRRMFNNSNTNNLT